MFTTSSMSVLPVMTEIAPVVATPYRRALILGPLAQHVVFEMF